MKSYERKKIGKKRRSVPLIFGKVFVDKRISVLNLHSERYCPGSSAEIKSEDPMHDNRNGLNDDCSDLI